MKQNSTQHVAGIDVSKKTLDVSIWPGGETRSEANTPSGRRKLIKWFSQLGVDRIGLEASGGYERQAALQLREAKFTVAVLQPAQVRYFAKAMLQRAKTDRIDAAVIARFTATLETIHDPGPPIAEELLEWLTLHEQIGDIIARLKTQRERFADPRALAWKNRAVDRAEVERKACWRKIRQLVAGDPVLAHRVALLVSIPGIGEQSAVILAARMPELGSLASRKIAALLGVAPFDDDSADRRGARHIEGGRKRPRRAVHMCALVATRHHPTISVFFNRLRAAGKPTMVALVACARKLIVEANAILRRGTPWTATFSNA